MVSSHSPIVIHFSPWTHHSHLILFTPDPRSQIPRTTNSTASPYVHGLISFFYSDSLFTMDAPPDPRSQIPDPRSQSPKAIDPIVDRHDITHAVLLITYLFLSVCTTRATSARPAVANSVVAIATGGKCVTGVRGGIREIPRGRRRGHGWYAPKRIAPTGAVFQPGRPNADFTTMMPVERQGGNADFFSN